MRLSLLVPPTQRLAGRLAFALAWQPHQPLLLLQALWTVALRVFPRVPRLPRIVSDLLYDEAARANVVLGRALVLLLLVCSS